MKMKKNFLSATLMVVFMLTATNSQAQSWADLLNKDNISKVVNAITGNTETIDMTGTWSYKSSAVEFESDNLLMKAGGAAAATMAENEFHVQCRQYFHQHSGKENIERNLLLQCFHQTSGLEIFAIAEPAR